MRGLIDLTGQKFGRLTVLRRAGSEANGNARWECSCECGQTAFVVSISLRKGLTRSCGCYRSAATATQNTNRRTNLPAAVLRVIDDQIMGVVRSGDTWTVTDLSVEIGRLSHLVKTRCLLLVADGFLNIVERAGTCKTSKTLYAWSGKPRDIGAVRIRAEAFDLAQIVNDMARAPANVIALSKWVRDAVVAGAH